MDLLTRLFGADLNPAGPLPTLPFVGPGHYDCAHDWLPGVRQGVAFEECVLCRVVRSVLPDLHQ